MNGSLRSDAKPYGLAELGLDAQSQRAQNSARQKAGTQQTRAGSELRNAPSVLVWITHQRNQQRNLGSAQSAMSWKNGYGSSRAWRKTRLIVFVRDEGICQICRKAVGARFAVDHIVARKFGGSEELNNLQLTCESCNVRKAASRESKVRKVTKRRTPEVHPGKL